MTVRRSSGITRRAIVAAVAVIAAIVAVTVAVRWEPGDGDRSGGSTDQALADAAPPTAMNTPQAGRRFITIGTTDGTQFTERQLRDLATNYSVIVFAKFHGGWDVLLHHEATRRLKELNPDLEVYAYVSTKYWFDNNDWDGAEPDPAWFLRDDAGELIRVTQERQDPDSEEIGTYVDVTIPEYRAWLLEVVQSWMAAAPYDGVRFDAADPIGDFGERDIRTWQELLSPDRIAAYNRGIRTLLGTFSEELAPDLVLFNGISPAEIRGPNRDLFLLGYTAGAMDEDFCVRPDGELHDIEADLTIMSRYAGERLQFRAPYPADVPAEADRVRLGRVCTAAFLLGWVPGSTRFNMGTAYGTEQLAQQPREIDLDLGLPSGERRHDGAVQRRTFERGEVLLNLTAQPAEVRLDDGSTRTVPPEDAVFVIN